MVILQGVYLKDKPKTKHVHNIIRNIQNTVEGETIFIAPKTLHSDTMHWTKGGCLLLFLLAKLFVHSAAIACCDIHEHCGLLPIGSQNYAVVTEIYYLRTHLALYIVDIRQQDHSGSVFTESKKKWHLTGPKGCCDRRKHHFYHRGNTGIQIIWKPYLLVIITKVLP